MALTKKEIRDIEKIAEQVIEENLGKLDRSMLPIDIHGICEKKNIKISVEDLEPGILGLYKGKDNLIKISSSLLPDAKSITQYQFYRANFTLAHELGHAVMHPDEEEIFREKDFYYKQEDFHYGLDITKKEQQANWFAASILMPRDLFTEACKYIEDDLKISVLFGVSRSAVYFRKVNLKLI